MGQANMKRITLRALLVGAAVLVMLAPMRASADEMSQSQRRKMYREGARLWPVYCSQCHQARPGSQFSPTQWNTIMMHMRTQSEMPAKDARAILEYLKAR
jgi:mono/diheme cytochrome c family protein